LGMVGFLIFAAILVKTARAVWRLPGNERLMWLAIGSTWFVGVLAATWETQKPTWLLIALVSAAARGHAHEFARDCNEEEFAGEYEFSS
jgi:hypothetical protein